MARAWVLLLCVYLLGWVPLGYATVFLATLPSLPGRGLLALLELVARGLITVLAATAGYMLWIRAPAAVAVAAAAVAATGTASILSLYWSALPRDVSPGSELPLAALIVAHTAFWLVMLSRRSSR